MFNDLLRFGLGLNLCPYYWHPDTLAKAVAPFTIFFEADLASLNGN